MKEQEVIDLFRERGFKVTTQRLAIYKYISSRDDHPTTEQIHDALQKDHPTISLGTIYKTLHLLKKLGLIQELGFNEGSIRYDPNMHLHINMVCTTCGHVKDFESETFKLHWNNLISTLDFKPEGQRIDLYYECDRCKKKHK
ncbi:MAG: transcriptional repressor [Promethearchaeota archaeon]|nr:MAG: transcriptional repressor [Candidatus Lokiarchaeota archaeon]